MAPTNTMPRHPVFSLLNSGFMRTCCPLRPDNNRCRRLSYCHNTRDGSGRDQEESQNAIRLHEAIVQHIKDVKSGRHTDPERDWLEGQVEELMLLKLCATHQDNRDQAVSVAMEMLEAECGRRPKKSRSSAPLPERTTNFHSHNEASYQQELHVKTPTDPGTREGGYHTYASPPQSMISHDSPQSYYSVATNPNRSYADSTATGPSAMRDETHQFHASSSDLAPSHVPTPPPTPRTISSRSPRSPESDIVSRVEQQFAQYPRNDTRLTVLDEFIENYKALKLSRDEKRSEKEQLHEQCESLKTENSDLTLSLSKTKGKLRKEQKEKARLQEQCESLKRENARLHAEIDVLDPIE